MTRESQLLIFALVCLLAGVSLLAFVPGQDAAAGSLIATAVAAMGLTQMRTAKRVVAVEKKMEEK